VLAYHILTNFSPLQFHKHEDKPGKPFAVIKTDTFSFNHVPQFTQVKLAGATEEELRVLDELITTVQSCVKYTALQCFKHRVPVFFT
jgi:aspartate-semialdehyde dehydrogenase